MGCPKLAYYPTPDLNIVSSEKELTPKNTVQKERSNNLYRYNGKEKDEETGLYNYGQRYYAPWLCRFVSVDPISEDYPQLSSYNYAGNKPVTSRDIEGLQGTEDPSQSKTAKGEGSQTSDSTQIPFKNTHTIEKGDTFWDLENQYNLTHGTLSKLNPQADAKSLKIGDEINLTPKQTSPDIFNIAEINSFEGKPAATDYQKQSSTFSGTVKGAGPLAYQWSKYTISSAKDAPTGFWETKVESDFTGSWGYGDIAGARLLFRFNKNVLDDLQTNSLVEVLNYGSASVFSHWGGLGFAQEGRFTGKAESGEVVWTAETRGLGFNVGYSPPQTSGEVEWSVRGNELINFKDSIDRALINLGSGRGNLKGFREFLPDSLKQ